MNQALFKRVYVEESGRIRVELAEPFHTLLGPAVDEFTAAASVTQEADWEAWEASFNEPEALEGAPGLSHETLVDLTGLEPAFRGRT
jgi:hypothetical protein